MLFIYEIRNKKSCIQHARQHRAALREYLLYNFFRFYFFYYLALYIVHCGSPSCERQSFLYTRHFFYYYWVATFLFLFFGRARSTCIVQCQGNSRAPFEMPSTGWRKLKKLGWRRKEKKRKKVVGCHCVRDDARSTSRTVVGCKRFITRAATLTIEKEKEKKGNYYARLFLYFVGGGGYNKLLFAPFAFS